MGPVTRAQPSPDPGRPGWSAGRRRRSGARSDRQRSDQRTKPDTERQQRDSSDAPEPPPTRRSVGQDAQEPGPRKITVTRVAAWRARNLTRAGARAFHRAASADGADRSGLTALTYAWMANYASDATLAVALANTLFFSAASAESKDKVALYLLITVAPFAVIAPVVGPLLDRVQRGRRLALALSTAGQGALGDDRYHEFRSCQQEVGGANDAVERGLAGAVTVVEQVLGVGVVDRDDGKLQHAFFGHGAQADHAGGGFFGAADHAFQHVLCAWCAARLTRSAPSSMVMWGLWSMAARM